jgi:hypothetical protein
MAGMLQLWWVLILVVRFVPDGFARWKAARRERLAVDWPVMPGRVRDGSTKLILGRRRLTLTYSNDEGGTGSSCGSMTSRQSVRRSTRRVC